MLRTSLLLSIVALAIVLSACSNNDPANPTGNTGTALKGDLVGWVQLRDLRGERLSDESGLTVSLAGTSHSAVTNSAGRWSMSGVPAGTYNVVFAKDGFSDYSAPGYQFVGGGTALFGIAHISMKPTRRITSFTILPDSIVERVHFDTLTRRYDTVWQTEYYRWRGTFDPATIADTSEIVMLYVNTDATVSNRPQEHIAEIPMIVLGGSAWIYKYQWQQYVTLPRGTRLYTRSYVAGASRTSVIDPATFDTYTTSLGPESPVVEMVIR